MMRRFERSWRVIRLKVERGSYTAFLLKGSGKETLNPVETRDRAALSR
jgi:hypothetical protein